MTLGVLLFASVGPVRAAGEVRSFWAQGVAPYDAADRAASRAAALKDLQRQAVLQAVGTLVRPETLLQNRDLLKERLFSRLDRYIESYRVFSEYPDGTLYRLQGSVDVNMDLLAKAVDQWIPRSAQPPLDAGEVPSKTDSKGETGQAGYRGARDIFWGVAENVDGKWVFPSNTDASATPLAGMILQESNDYLWTLGFPSLNPPAHGDPRSPDVIREILHQARQEGRRFAVVGAVTEESQGLAARLQVFDVATGRRLGFVEEQVPPSVERQDALVQLAALVVSSVDALLAGSVRAETSTEPGRGPWSLVVHGEHPYAAWLSMEPVFSESLPEFRIRKITLEATRLVAVATGLDPEKVQTLDGVRIGDDALLRITGWDPARKEIDVALNPATDSSEDASTETSGAP